MKEEHWELASRAWPSLELSREGFERFVDSGDPPSAPDGWPELYLAYGCASGEREALELFDSEYLSVVPGALAHMGLAPQQVDEVQQLVREKLLLSEGDEPPRLSLYAGQGKLRGLVKVMAVRTAISALRSSKRRAGGGAEALANLPALEFDPELQVMKKHYRETFARAFEEAVAALSKRDRNVLRLNLLDGLTVEQVGGMYRVHRATATRWLAKIRGDLLKDTRRRMKLELQIGNTELDSVMRLIESRLDVSVQRMLQTRNP